MIRYLKLPLRLAPFFEKSALATCSLRESICGNLHLLIMTTIEENATNLDYGCAFWDQEFDTHLSPELRRETILNTLKRQIAAFEKRIDRVLIEVRVKQVDVPTAAGVVLRRRIELIIRGMIVRSNEPFSFQTGFFIGPLAFD